MKNPTHLVLSNGTHCLVDRSALRELSKYTWWQQKNGYVVTDRRINGKNKRIYMHRLLMKPAEGMVVDHINGIVTDNRRANLRVCTRSENMRNIRTKRLDKPKGVTLAKNGKWQAQIGHNGQNIFLGQYSTQKDAIIAYRAVSRILHGQFSNV